MSFKHQWANPVQTSGWQNYHNGWVYSNGIGMPTARVDWYGNRPIRVHSFGDFYNSSGFMRMNYGGNLLDQGGVAVFGGSGGTFQWEAHSNTTMFFGRDPGCCTVTSFNDGFVWAGLLAGSFWWDQVPVGPPVSLSVSGRNLTVHVSPTTDDGGTPIDQYSVQIEKDGTGWQPQRNGGTTTYENLMPGNYRARAWCHNAVGFSQPTVTGYVAIRSGGKRFDGSQFNPTNINRRWNGSAWVDLQTMKRWTGAAWVDLS